MDFERWIRDELSAQGRNQAPGHERPRRTRHVSPALQATGAVLAAAAIWAGVAASTGPATTRVALVTPVSRDLPANSWDGPAPMPSPSTDQAQARAAAATSVPAGNAVSGGLVPGTPRTAPPSPPSRAAQPAPAATGGGPPAPSSQTFRLAGGTVGASCQGAQLTLDSVVANPGYQSETDWHDGGSTARVRFTSASHQSQLEAWCSAGQVQGQVQEQGS